MNILPYLLYIIKQVYHKASILALFHKASMIKPDRKLVYVAPDTHTHQPILFLFYAFQSMLQASVYFTPKHISMHIIK